VTAAELEAALIATGLDPQLATLATAIAVARQSGTLVHVYGQLLKPVDALVLRERVAAVEDQMKKQQITIDDARTALNDLEIPVPNRDALLAAWAALIVAKPAHGVFLQR
jgi:hypothetical protein